MKLEFYPLEKLKKEVLEITKQYLVFPEYRVFFFGSRVLGQGTECSDINLGIEGPQEVPLSTMARIKEDLEELPILYKIDLVDFKTASDDFRAVALQYIEPVTKAS